MVTPGPEAAGALVLAFGEEALGLSPENTRSSLETMVGRSPGLPFICMHGHHVGSMFAWRIQCHARKSTCNIIARSRLTSSVSCRIRFLCGESRCGKARITTLLRSPGELSSANVWSGVNVATLSRLSCAGAPGFSGGGALSWVAGTN